MKLVEDLMLDVGCLVCGQAIWCGHDVGQVDHTGLVSWDMVGLFPSGIEPAVWWCFRWFWWHVELEFYGIPQNVDYFHEFII